MTDLLDADDVLLLVHEFPVALVFLCAEAAADCDCGHLLVLGNTYLHLCAKAEGFGALHVRFESFCTC